MVKNLYKSCMNTDKIEKDGIKPVQEIIDKLGGWPLIVGDDWNEGNFDLESSIYQLKSLGFDMYNTNFFVSLKVKLDAKNSNNYMLTVKNPYVGLPRPYLIKGFAKNEAYYNFMVKTGVWFGADKEKAETQMKEVLQFMIKLAEITVPAKDLSDDKIYNKMTVAELSQKWPGMPWLEYINKMMAPYQVMKNEDTVIMNIPAYFDKFQHFIKTAQKRVLANYVIFRVIGNLMNFMPSSARAIKQIGRAHV